MTKYNGYKNWNHWNVSLYINNEEPLYRAALFHTRNSKNRESAARAMLEELKASGVTKTPDGAPYSVSAIRAAMVEM
jgi:hypothetical protein